MDRYGESADGGPVLPPMEAPDPTGARGRDSGGSERFLPAPSCTSEVKACPRSTRR